MSVIERIPPHNIEAEQRVIASLLVDCDAVPRAMGLLEPGDFYQARHGAIYAAACRLFSAGRPVDLVTVQQALANAGNLEECGGWGYLVDLAGSIPTTAFVEHYAGIIADAAQRRAGIQACMASLEGFFDGGNADPAAAALGRLMTVAAAGNGAEPCREFGGVLDDTLERIDEAIADPRGTAGRRMETGVYDIDRRVGIEPGQLVILGARPSTGKTALALQIILHVARARPVLFFSLEMQRRELGYRFFAGAAGLEIRRMQGGHVHTADREKLQAARAAYAGALHVDDRAALTVAQMFAEARRQQVAQGQGWGLVVIDHLLHVRPTDTKASRHHQLGQISKDLVRMGRDLGAPVLLLTQLNRASEREERPPRMSDLRESGSLEEDADIVWLLHRPEREERPHLCDLVIAKNRNGEVGKVALHFDAARLTFSSRAFDGGPT